MKKMFLFAAMASVAFASCTTDESSFISEKKEIKFQSAIYSPQTRAEHDATLVPTENFRVAAWIEGSDSYYMREDMTPQGATVNGNTYYWPTDGAGLDFLAISPAGSFNDYAVATRQNGEATINFAFTSTNPNPNSINLMFADYVKGQKATTSTQVSLLFRHALANLHVEVEQSLQEDPAQKISWEVKVTSLKIKNVKNMGTFTVPWDFDATAQDYYWENTSGAFTWTQVSSPISIKYGKFISSGNHYVMPQEFDPAAPITLDIEYDIVTTYSLSGQTSTVSYTKSIELDDIKYDTASGTGVTLDGFAMNKEITITVKINPSATLTPITFTVKEEEWGKISGSPELKVD